MVNLSNSQKEVMTLFYEKPVGVISFNKSRRNEIWSDFKKSRVISEPLKLELKNKCPALLGELEKSARNIKNVQSAVFSECVYAQTLANIFGLREFLKSSMPNLPKGVQEMLNAYHLTPRYVYKKEDDSVILVQAGGCADVDAALLYPKMHKCYLIEFKERGAKTSEPDLPKYLEDGYLTTNEKFQKKYPQFSKMIDEQIEKHLNFFEKLGVNIHDFSDESILEAVTENYNVQKYADVICTESSTGELIMIPANQVSKWADLEGEIRPAGRNNYGVWTPYALKKQLKSLGAFFEDGIVTVKADKLVGAHARGGDDKISRYKICTVFFVRPEDCIFSGNEISFYLKDVRQLNPTIAGKMFFRNFCPDDVKSFYEAELDV